ncbi:MAG: High-affinity branched-chain amino acid transport ATP-binding protein LivF [Herbaspirillum frisingense]|uniref:High-affinity branched-chain amino acid transport ATP-binding protein LivF n=1 Tax=Herbaspirillum frisingense TaxID=92645 RepID=A0A7V8FU51_9BURK|nr:MAG: High-affinity branched-chain amino acid transport ATP-binding protein LivF [Herbaspirillum frisingense]
MDKREPLLVVAALHAWYGQSHVLQGVDLQVEAGEIVSVLGRNGAGRSTLLKALTGQVRSEGAIRFAGADIRGLPTYEIARKGMGYVPESRDVFPALTVEQNLLLGRKSGPQPAGGWRFDDMYGLFPSLHKRRGVAAGALSGGEQQMLALARTLMGNPALVLIDEPTEGLSPQMVEQVARYLEQLRERRVAVLLIEQKQAIALEMSQRVYVMGRGEIVFHGTPQALLADAGVQRDWLSV